MSTQRYTPEFKEEAVRQIVDRGYSVADVSARLGVSSHSLYQWVKAVTPDKTEKQASHWSGPIAWPGNALNAPLHRGQRRCRRRNCSEPRALLHWPPTTYFAPYWRTRRRPISILSTSWRWPGERSFLIQPSGTGRERGTGEPVYRAGECCPTRGNPPRMRRHLARVMLTRRSRPSSWAQARGNWRAPVGQRVVATARVFAIRSTTGEFSREPVIKRMCCLPTIRWNARRISRFDGAPLRHTHARSGDRPSK